jgi:uncharacterized surface protein with fasciclin (FAS1) repeats
MRKLLHLAAVALLALLAVVPAFAQEQPSIPELLANDADGRFTTLLAAVEAAGLAETLSGEGPFTVLAPTNDAFAAALEFLGISAEDLLSDTETLEAVLLYHVIPERAFFRTLAAGPTLTTASGEELTFTVENGVLSAAGAGFIDVDNLASNGIVHVAEAVLLPPALLEAAQANRAFVRVAHLSPDAGAVDIYLNDAITDLQAVEFGTISEYFEVPARGYRVGVAVAGGDPTKNTLGRVNAGEYVTIAVIGTRADRQWEIVFLREDRANLAEGDARVSVFHAVQAFGPVDIRANGALLIGNLAFPGFYGDNDGLDTRDVPAGSYALEVVAQGTTSPAALAATLNAEAGTYYLIVAAGVPSAPQLFVATSGPAAE